MANLIPPANIKTYTREWNIHIATAFCIVACIVGVLAHVALIPVYAEVHTSLASIDQQLAALTSPAATSTPTGQAAIARAHTQLIALQKITAHETSASHVLDVLNASRPKGLSLEHVIFSRAVDGATVSVRGTLTDPALLDTYRTQLQATGLFAAIHIPVSALADTQGGTFTFDATGDW